MRIGELAHQAGVNARTIRYYEDIHVLPRPERAANGYRDYRSEALDRLRFVKDAQAAGLTLGEISRVLEMRDRGGSTCEHVIQLLEGRIGDLNSRISALYKGRRDLLALLAGARRLHPSDCTDPGRCQTITAGSAQRAKRGSGPLGTAPRPVPSHHRH